MGVINITPNSFSGLGETLSPVKVNERIEEFGNIDALDVGAESTAPMNDSIGFKEEWKRLEPFLSTLKSLNIPISIDTYHPETIKQLASIWKDEGIKLPLIWNDVSGKFDQYVGEFLDLNNNFYYVYCHNLAPKRELAGKHMDFISNLEGDQYLEELASYFRLFRRERVILDPTLGFSKTYEQNWLVLSKFGELQKRVDHDNWLLGFSRKSFLRKRLGFEKITPENREQLDLYHQKILKELIPSLKGTVWIRTHRPDLMNL